MNGKLLYYESTKTSAFYNAPRLFLRSVFFFFSDIKKIIHTKKIHPQFQNFGCAPYICGRVAVLYLCITLENRTLLKRHWRRNKQIKYGFQFLLKMASLSAAQRGGGCSSLFFLSFLTAAKKKRRNREKVTVTTGMSSRGSRKGRRITSRSTAWRSWPRVNIPWPPWSPGLCSRRWWSFRLHVSCWTVHPACPVWVRTQGHNVNTGRSGSQRGNRRNQLFDFKKQNHPSSSFRIVSFFFRDRDMIGWVLPSFCIRFIWQCSEKDRNQHNGKV